MWEQSQDFARAFGDALFKFLQEKGLTHTEVSNLLKLGERGNARLYSYFHDSRKGTRPVPAAEILYLVCTELGFEFEYKGYRITAGSLNGNGTRPVVEKPAEQLPLEFNAQFNLTDNKGTVDVSFKRPPGRVEFSVRLKAAS